MYRNKWQSVELKWAYCLWSIAALLQGWFCAGILCAMQMGSNVRLIIRDFALKYPVA
jgi:hypothetical protein